MDINPICPLLEFFGIFSIHTYIACIWETLLVLLGYLGNIFPAFERFPPTTIQRFFCPWETLTLAQPRPSSEKISDFSVGRKHTQVSQKYMAAPPTSDDRYIDLASPFPCFICDDISSFQQLFPFNGGQSICHFTKT